MIYTIELLKNVKKRLNDDKVDAQIEEIVDSAESNARRSRGWSVDHTVSNRFAAGGHIYHCKLTCSCNGNKSNISIKQDFDNMVKDIASTANRYDWQINFINDRLFDDTVPTKSIGYIPVDIPTNWKDNFSHIYDRDSQIDIIMSTIEAGISSNFQDRFHCALIGDPACGKTETLRSVKKTLGEDAVLEYDATATTQAGAIKDLNERDELPRILIVEEIEKTDEASLRWLLSVMDHRAEIRKVNYREHVQKETRMLTLATVNDYKLFQKIMYGALASRFAYHLHFPKPDESLLRKILEREVARVKGDKRWIKPSLEFAISEEIYDPRKITAICLCGKDRLLDKSYQKKLKECAVPQD